MKGLTDSTDWQRGLTVAKRIYFWWVRHGVESLHCSRPCDLGEARGTRGRLQASLEVPGRFLPGKIKQYQQQNADSHVLGNVAQHFLNKYVFIKTAPTPLEHSAYTF